MLFLFLAIVLGMSFGLIVKHCQRRGYNVMAVGCVNYFAACVFGVGWAALAAPHKLDAPGIMLGALGGFTYVLSYYFITYCVKRHSISMPITMANLSAAVPVLVAMMFWKERPNVWQSVGLALALPSILLLSVRSKNSGLNHSAWVGILGVALFFSAGASRTIQKTFRETCDPSARPVFMAVWFTASAVMAGATMIVLRVRPSRTDILWGTILGATNVLQLCCMLLSLRALPAMVVYPVFSSATLAGTALIARIVWGEQIGRKGTIGIAIALIALVFLNIRT